jgi:hypothetical protein
LNQVFGPQANIWFNKPEKNMPLAIPGLGKEVTPDHAKMLAEHKDAQVARPRNRKPRSGCFSRGRCCAQSTVNIPPASIGLRAKSWTSNNGEAGAPHIASAMTLWRPVTDYG